MIRSLYVTPGQPIQKDCSLEQMKSALEDPQGLLWISIEGITQNEADQILTGLFHFHPLAIEDCLNTGYQVPKVDDFEAYLFLIVHALMVDEGLENFETQELNCFIGDNYLVTTTLEKEMASIDKTWKRIDKDNRLLTHGSDFLCHGILDAMVDEYMPLLDKIDDEIEMLEDLVLEKPQPVVLQRILSLKHSLVILRRVMNPLREVMNRLSRDTYRQIDPHALIYFRDIYDQLVRYQDLVESLRDVVGDTLSTYLSAASNRLNEIMKALTIVSTIFLPLSFIAGVYGMNFHYMPELNWPLGYPFVIVIFGSTFFGMMVFFRKKGWW